MCDRQHRIRRATLEDIDQLSELDGIGFGPEAFSRSRLKYLLSKGQATILAVECEGTLVGSAVILWRKDSSKARIYSILIHPTHQGLGLGRRLLSECEDLAVQSGRTCMSLEVRADNSRAIHFYDAHGYTNVKSLPNYYDFGIEGLRMEKHFR